MTDRWTVIALLVMTALLVATVWAIDAENQRAECEIAQRQFRVC